jgi:hypothetical protein
VQELFSNRVSAFFDLDVIGSAVVAQSHGSSTPVPKHSPRGYPSPARLASASGARFRCCSICENASRAKDNRCRRIQECTEAGARCESARAADGVDERCRKALYSSRNRVECSATA